MSEPELSDPNDATGDERRLAYRKAREASGLLDEAAAALLRGGDVHDLADAAFENEAQWDNRFDYGIKAITNAHSYLNNGDLEGIHPDSD